MKEHYEEMVSATRAVNEAIAEEVSKEGEPIAAEEVRDHYVVDSDDYRKIYAIASELGDRIFSGVYDNRSHNSIMDYLILMGTPYLTSTLLHLSNYHTAVDVLTRSFDGGNYDYSSVIAWTVAFIIGEINADACLSYNCKHDELDKLVDNYVESLSFAWQCKEKIKTIESELRHFLVKDPMSDNMVKAYKAAEPLAVEDFVYQLLGKNLNSVVCYNSIMPTEDRLNEMMKFKINLPPMLINGIDENAPKVLSMMGVPTYVIRMLRGGQYTFRKILQGIGMDDCRATTLYDDLSTELLGANYHINRDEYYPKTPQTIMNDSDFGF